MANSKGLRWQGHVRTRNGHITAYYRVRAWCIEDAVVKLPRIAFRDWLKTHDEGEQKMYPHTGPEDFIVIGVHLDPRDQNHIDDRKRKK